MIDYKLLADNDPGGTLKAAFTSMSAETITTKPELRVTYIGIADKVGFAEAAELAAGIKAAIASSTLPEWVENSLNTGGVNANDPQVVGLLGSLVSPATATKLLAMGNVVTAKYPQLTAITFLEKARTMRTEGRI